METLAFPENLLTTCGLSILLHGVISLPDATSLFIMIKPVKRASVELNQNYPNT